MGKPINTSSKRNIKPAADMATGFHINQIYYKKKELPEFGKETNAEELVNT